MNVLSIDEALAADKSHAEWVEYFGGLTWSQFSQLYILAIDKLPVALRRHDLWSGHLHLMTALAAKMLMAGHFKENLDVEGRISTIEMAEKFFGWVRSLIGNNETKAAADSAWAATQDYCRRFGYSNEPIYRILTPDAQRQFRDG